MLRPPWHGLINPILFVSSAFELSHLTNQALDALELPPHLRRKCLGGLCWICGHHALLPKSLQIPLCYDRSDDPLYRGGFSDMWKGKHNGRHVAVLVLRIYSTSDFVKITNVGSHSLLKRTYDPLILTVVEVLQGGRDVERSPSSERVTAVGSDDGHPPLLNDIGVDGKWGHQRVYQVS